MTNPTISAVTRLIEAAKEICDNGRFTPIECTELIKLLKALHLDTGEYCMVPRRLLIKADDLSGHTLCRKDDYPNAACTCGWDVFIEELRACLKGTT